MTAYDLTEYRILKVWAEMFHDAQCSRIRSENRIRSAPVFPDLFKAELDATAATEHRIGLALVRQYRRTVPAGVLVWQKEAKGVGVHLLARLVGHLGHPRVATPSHWEGAGSERKLVPDEPYERTLSELRQYCGHGRPDVKPAKGAPFEEWAALGCPSLKMLVHLLAECSIKEPGRKISDLLSSAQPPSEHTSPTPVAVAGQPSDQPPTLRPKPKVRAAADPHSPPQPISGAKTIPGAAGGDSSGTDTPKECTVPIGQPVWPYRIVYEQRRLATLGRLHAEPCVRCGPSGRPAMPGKPWSDAHAHADALRIVGKAILRDLYEAAAE